MAIRFFGATGISGGCGLVDEFVDQLQIRMNEADRIIEFVGHTGDELAQTLELLALHELILRLLKLPRPALDAHFKALVQLRDLIEGLGIFDGD